MEHCSVNLVNMTHRYEVLVTRHARATPSTLFDVVADGSRWSEWAKPLINYSAFPVMMKNMKISDTVAILGSLNVIAGELDR